VCWCRIWAARRGLVIFSVIETCKAIGVDLQAYIADVIARIAGNWPA
jgi:hypothetical protein